MQERAPVRMTGVRRVSRGLRARIWESAKGWKMRSDWGMCRTMLE